MAQTDSLLLRGHEGKTTFRVGEPIALEVACIDSSGNYLSLCYASLQVEPRTRGDLSFDAVDSSMLEDVLCGQYQVEFCGTPVDLHLPTVQRSSQPKWQEVTLDENFPMSRGRYSVTASLDSPRDSFSGKSQALEITLTDDPEWKTGILHFEDCNYNETLTVLHDARSAIAALRAHLGDCAKQNDYRDLTRAIAAIVWLDLESNHTETYRSIREFHRLHSGDTLRPPYRKEPAPIRRWVRARYRELVLETANQLVREYQSHPDKRGDPDYDHDFDEAFTNWQKSVIVGCVPFLNASEVQRLLRAAGRGDEYIHNALQYLGF